MKKMSMLLLLIASTYALGNEPADLSSLESQRLYEDVTFSSSQAKDLVNEASRSIASNPTWSNEDQKWLDEFKQILNSEDSSI